MPKVQKRKYMEINSHYRLTLNTIPILPHPNSQIKPYYLIKNDIIKFLGEYEDMGIKLYQGEMNGVKFLFNPSYINDFVEVSMKEKLY